MNNDIQIWADIIGKVLANEASPQEVANLDAWIEQNNENRAFYEEMKSVWQITTPNSGFDINLDAEWEAISGALNKEGSRSTKLRTLYRVVAAAAAVALLAVLLVNPTNQDVMGGGDHAIIVQADQSTENTRIVLPDASIVWLRKGSELTYDEDFSPRSVELSGEAFFEVESDPSNPFSVEMADARVNVIGTKFNLRETAFGDVELFVEEGKVAFLPKNVQPGQDANVFTREQQAVMKLSTGNIEILNTPFSNVTSWKTGRLLFNDDSMGRVFGDLERHYGKQFVVSDTAMLNCGLRADFQNNSEAEIIESIAFMMGWEVETTPDGYILSGEPCKSENR